MEIEQISKTTHEVHLSYCRSMGIDTQGKWEEISEAHKNGIISSVKGILLGEISTKVESHNNFINNKIKDGWKWGEYYCKNKKTNPRLVVYQLLSLEDKVKESLFFDCVSSFK